MSSASHENGISQKRFITGVNLIKARLHLQFLLQFLVRFSPSDGCERVDE